MSELVETAYNMKVLYLYASWLLNKMYGTLTKHPRKQKQFTASLNAKAILDTVITGTKMLQRNKSRYEYIYNTV
jgi:hypothetical protein